MACEPPLYHDQLLGMLQIQSPLKEAIGTTESDVLLKLVPMHPQ